MQHVGAQQETKTKLRKDAQVLKCGNAMHVLQGQWPKKRSNMTVPLLHPGTATAAGRSKEDAMRLWKVLTNQCFTTPANFEP